MDDPGFVSGRAPELLEDDIVLMDWMDLKCLRRVERESMYWDCDR
jgi:hypothetical protein